jgi:RimJ/RimL family protein N-acetyltransferase
LIVREATRDRYAWIAQRAPLTAGPEFRAIEAVDAAGRIHGMIGYDGWTPNAVTMHIALENPAALRSLLRPAFRVPFLGLGRQVALASVLGNNARSLALVRSVGFREACRIRDGFAVGVDLVIFEMRRDDCRWLPESKEAAWAA